MLLRALAAATAVLLGACSADRSEDVAASEDQREPGIYEVDSETGEIRAHVVQEDGSITSMRSGDTVPLDLPDGFTAFPEAEIVSNTVVDSGQGTKSIVVMRTAQPPSAVIDHYRDQVEAAGIVVEFDLVAGGTHVLGGKSPEGATFSVSASQEAGQTKIDLTVARQQAPEAR